MDKEWIAAMLAITWSAATPHGSMSIQYLANKWRAPYNQLIGTVLVVYISFTIRNIIPYNTIII